MADVDDLDQLLDSALDDFTNLSPASAHKSEGEEKNNALAAAAMPSSSVQGLGLGMGLPDPKKGKKPKKKAGEATPKGSSHASEALEKLTQQTREAVMGLGTTTMGDSGIPGGDLDNERLMEDFVKRFEGLSGSQDMESVVETMMQQLLSKEILHEPMREIGERYPTWLEEHKAGLSPEEYDRFSRQYELMIKLNNVYEHEPDNFPKIVELMQKMQECGQPPSDIVHELAPDLDLANFGAQLTPEMLESTPNCCIM